MFSGAYRYLFESVNQEGYQAVGAVIVSPNKKILLLLRNERTPTWSWPGGGVDKGETLIGALTREIYEEMNIFDTAYSINSQNPDYSDTTTNTFPYHVFICKCNEEFKPKLNHEHINYGWFSKDELPNELHPGTKHFLTISDLFNNI